MTDLAARALAAIDVAESTARAAELRAPGPWSNESWTESPLPHAEGICEANGDGIAAVRGGYLAKFFMANQPQDVLRRCAADRRTVERHRLRGKSVLRNGQFVDYCAACNNQPIPCPDLRDRAEAYGVAL